MARIYLSPPDMGPHERSLLLEAFDSGWIAPLGPHVNAFEAEFAQRVGASHAVALSSGTAALHLALILLGVRAGDEVITSTLTFAATANAIRYVGADPVFIDAEARSWNLDPELLEAELEAGARHGRLPKAVLAVDLYGQLADFERIVPLCQRYGVPLIEDAAEALGAHSKGRSAGTFGKFGAFSFNGNKIITTSGGGMLVTEDGAVAERARYLATQARDPAPHYQHSVVGYNYRLSNLLAAVGRGQLRELDRKVAARTHVRRRYEAELGSLPGLSFMPSADFNQPNHWLTCVTIDPARFGSDREDVRRALEGQDIEARPVWKPMHLQPVFAGFRARERGVAARLFELGLCLPSGSNLAESDQARVIEIVRAQCRSS
ncbi:MAG TPA: aminotransferase class I/II-fold pyridoxal phosphate-dependent enzyme [Polyangiaceae bacterium]|nr:aminotransferase class I/II-fold pyridoxal phosphate-dependent enzyme [Polyangiaceae bacterium]